FHPFVLGAILGARGCCVFDLQRQNSIYDCVTPGPNMPLVLNVRVWVLAERLYLHAHGGAAFRELLNSCDIDYREFDYEKEFATSKGKYTFMSEDSFVFAQFMQLVASYKYLPLLERVIFDDDVKGTRDDNWNYYGEYIKKWYPELLDLLHLAGVKIEEPSMRVVYAPIDELSLTEGGRDFVGQAFADVFLDHIRRELNQAYAEGLYLATMFLARKMVETSLFRIMEVVFPKFVNKEYSE